MRTQDIQDKILGPRAYIAFIGLPGEKLERAAPPRSRSRPTLSTVVRPSPWVFGDTEFPKDGKHSLGVRRQYSGTMGKLGHCQIDVPVHAVGAKGRFRWSGRWYPFRGSGP